MRIKFFLSTAAALASVFTLFSAPAAHAEDRVRVTIMSQTLQGCLSAAIPSGFSQVRVRPCDGSPNQVWDMVTDGIMWGDNLIVHFQSVAWGTCMTRNSIYTIVSENCADADNQRFRRYIDAGSDYYPIVSLTEWTRALRCSSDVPYPVASMGEYAGGPDWNWRITPV